MTRSLKFPLPSPFAVDIRHSDRPARPNPSPPTPPPAVKTSSAVPAPKFIPWLTRLGYFLGRYGVIPLHFSRVEVMGQEHLPRSGAVILAPTHRSRWDALMVPYAAGFDTTGRHLRFMVSADEVAGLQGWLIRRMGGFAIDTQRPAIASLRYGVELLQSEEPVVIFPEGDIFREAVQPLKPGLARIALQAASQVEVTIVPMQICYSHPLVPWGSRVKIRIGQPIQVADYACDSPKQNAKRLTATLQSALKQLERETLDTKF